MTTSHFFAPAKNDFDALVKVIKEEKQHRNDSNIKGVIASLTKAIVMGHAEKKSSTLLTELYAERSQLYLQIGEKSKASEDFAKILSFDCIDSSINSHESKEPEEKILQPNKSDFITLAAITEELFLHNPKKDENDLKLPLNWIEKAITEYQKCIKLGLDLTAEKFADKIISYLHEAKKHCTLGSIPLNLLARMYYQQKNYTKAITSYEQAIEMLTFSENKNLIANSYLYQGISLYYLKKYDEAREMIMNGIFHDHYGFASKHEAERALGILGSIKEIKEKQNPTYNAHLKALSRQHFNSLNITTTHTNSTYPENILYLDHLIEMNPTNHSAYFKRATIRKMSDNMLSLFDIATAAWIIDTGAAIADTKTKHAYYKLRRDIAGYVCGLVPHTRAFHTIYSSLLTTKEKEKDTLTFTNRLLAIIDDALKSLDKSTQKITDTKKADELLNFINKIIQYGKIAHALHVSRDKLTDIQAHLQKNQTKILNYLDEIKNEIDTPKLKPHSQTTKKSDKKKKIKKNKIKNFDKINIQQKNQDECKIESKSDSKSENESNTHVELKPTPLSPTLINITQDYITKTPPTNEKEKQVIATKIPTESKNILLPFIVIEYLRKLEEHGFKAYIVGGYIEDELLSISRKKIDVDIVTDATPDEIKKLFASDSAQANKYDTNLFNIVRENLNIDIRYSSALANKQSHQPLLDDAKKRDKLPLYTTKDGKVIDITGQGLDALNRKMYTLTGSANEIFEKDPICMLRAIYCANKRDQRLDEDIWKTIPLKAHLLMEKCNPGKINSWLLKLFTADNYVKNLRFLINLGLFKALFPKIADDINHRRMDAKHILSIENKFDKPNLQRIFDQFLGLGENEIDELIKANLAWKSPRP